MTIESYVIQYLEQALGISVTGLVPEQMPDRFVTVEKTGSQVSNYITSASLAIQSWARTQADAVELNELVKAAMGAMDVNPEISACDLDSDYNFTDEESKMYRYQAIFTVVYFL